MFRSLYSLVDRARARILRLADPWLHAARQNRAITGLPRDMSSLLVICYGNICRSPFAARALARELGTGGPDVVSAGFFGPNRPSPDEALRAAARRRLNLDDHRSQLVDADMVKSADLIVVMDQSHVTQLRSRFSVDRRRIVFLGDFDPEPVATRAIADPYGGDAGVFDACYGRVERCAALLASSLRARQHVGHNQPRAR